MTVTYLPAAADDSDLGNTIGTTVNVPVLSNDSGSFVLTSVRIVHPRRPGAPAHRARRRYLAGERDGTVTFFPEVGFRLDPRPSPTR